jgi:hypothetical protein
MLKTHKGNATPSGRHQICFLKVISTGEPVFSCDFIKERSLKIFDLTCSI